MTEAQVQAHGRGRGASASMRALGGSIYFGPAVLLTLVILGFPLLYMVYVSVGGTKLSIEAYQRLLNSRLFRQSLWTTLQISFLCSAASVVLAYPIAMHLARQNPKRRMIYMMMVLMPLWTSILVKSFSFAVLLGRQGLINSTLSWLTASVVELPLIYNRLGIVIAMSNYLVPFSVLLILASFLSIDPALKRAAEIMGARPPRIFLTITLPLSLPGAAAAFFVTMVMSLGIFVVPSLLGGRTDMMLSNLIDFYTRETLDWEAASAIGIILLLLVVATSIPAAYFRRDNAAR